MSRLEAPEREREVRPTTQAADDPLASPRSASAADRSATCSPRSRDDAAARGDGRGARRRRDLLSTPRRSTATASRSTASASACAASPRDSRRAVDQGRPAAPARPGRGDRGPFASTLPFDDRPRLFLRRRDALARGQPAAARPRAHRHRAASTTSTGSGRATHLERALRRIDGGRLSRARRAARGGRDPRDRRRRERCRTARCATRATATSTASCSPAATPARHHGAAAAAAALRTRAASRILLAAPLQLRHPRHRRRARREVLVRGCAARDHGARARASRRSAPAPAYRSPPPRCSSRFGTSGDGQRRRRACAAPGSDRRGGRAAPRHPADFWRELRHESCSIPTRRFPAT